MKQTQSTVPHLFMIIVDRMYSFTRSEMLGDAKAYIILAWYRRETCHMFYLITFSYMCWLSEVSIGNKAYFFSYWGVKQNNSEKLSRPDAAVPADFKFDFLATFAERTLPCVLFSRKLSGVNLSIVVEILQQAPSTMLLLITLNVLRVRNIVTVTLVKT